jgi:flagellar motor switch/type III secretory pathway protein FliN
MRAVQAALDVEALPGALASVLAADVRITLNDIVPSEAPPDPNRSIHVATADRSVLLSIAPSAALGSVLLARILERPVHLVDGDAPLEDSIRGALTALAVEVARRAGGTSELVALRDGPRGDGLGIRATVILDERPYGVSVWADGTRSRDAGTESLGDLGDTPVSVPLVAAESTATGREISELCRGDVWMPGAGWFSGADSIELPDMRSTLRRAVLAAPSSERGVAVGGSDDGKIVLVGTAIALARDVQSSKASSDESNMGGQNEDLNQVVLDSPVVVRVEVGTVTLTAREWAALRPGDVIEMGVDLMEPVVLRVAGNLVARGELVNVDGELGVKIVELVAPGRTP